MKRQERIIGGLFWLLIISSLVTNILIVANVWKHYTLISRRSQTMLFVTAYAICIVVAIILIFILHYQISHFKYTKSTELRRSFLFSSFGIILGYIFACFTRSFWPECAVMTDAENCPKELSFKMVFYEIIKSIDLINLPSILIVSLYVFQNSTANFLPEIKTESGYILLTTGSNGG